MEKYVQYLENKLPDIGNFALKVVLALAAYFIASKIIGLISKAFRKSMEKARMPLEVITFLNSIVKAGLYALLLFSIASYFGLQASSVAAIVASAGVGISLALQGGLSNLAGGVILLFLKPFTVGDYIVDESSKKEGTVRKIEMYYTTLVTYDNQKIMIPNSELTNHTITNVTSLDQRLLEIKIGISYESDIKRAKELLEQMIAGEELILHEKPVLIFVDQLADSSVVLALRVWVKTENYWKERWRLNEEIKLAFDHHKIKIPYAQVEVHMG